MITPNTRLAFIGGIHGVGKSHFSSQLAGILGILHVSAGDLITRQRQTSSQADKRVTDVSGNQDVLITAIRASALIDKTFILDGHFCVLDSMGKICEIPMATFATLAPACAIVLTDDISTIRERLRRRDNKDHPAKIMESLQQAEVAHAKQVCNALEIPLEIYRSQDAEAAKQFILRGIKN